MCLRTFPNSSGLTRAGSGPLVPSKLICHQSEKSSLHCCLLDTLYHQPQELCRSQQRGREESRYFLLLGLMKKKGTRDAGSSAD